MPIKSCILDDGIVRKTEGIGSTANLMLSRIERRVTGSITNFLLFSPNGDTRI